MPSGCAIRCVNTVSGFGVLTQLFTSILIVLYRSRLFAITPGSLHLFGPGPDEFVCFGLGPVADEQFRSQRFGHDKDLVRLSHPLQTKRSSVPNYSLVALPLSFRSRSARRSRVPALC